ncbi:MAG: AMP-binding protein [Streptosporangiaceae bacterium]
MYPGTYAAHAPDRLAAVMTGTGESLSYADLERRSVQLAHVLYDAGLRPGDVVALLTENNLRAFEVYWAAMRSGLYITAVNFRLKPDEVAYIVDDCDAAALIVSAEQAETAEAISAQTGKVKLRLAFGGPVAGHGSYEEIIAGAPAEPFADQPHGAPMLYSSGTTGQPKGVRPPLPGVQVSQAGDPVVVLAGRFFGVTSDSVYLSPAPLYHAAPLRWSAAVQAHGGTVVVMKKFDAEQALQAIEDRHVTHAQFVPTMFVRMLQLPPEVRERYDVSSLQVAIHAAAPCPVEVKQKMIVWSAPRTGPSCPRGRSAASTSNAIPSRSATTMTRTRPARPSTSSTRPGPPRTCWPCTRRSTTWPSSACPIRRWGSRSPRSSHLPRVRSPARSWRRRSPPS